MRILIATQTYDPPLNGQGVFAIHLSRGLARAGHEVLVLRPSELRRPYRRRRRGLEVQGVRALPLLPFSSEVFVTPCPRSEVAAAFERFRPDVVHFQDHYPLCRSAVAAARRRGLPMVGTNHFMPLNIIDEVGLFRLAPGLVDPLLWRWVTSVFGRADVVTSPSETAASLLRARRLKVRAVSNGVDTAHFRPDPRLDRAAVRRRYGLDPRRTVLLFVGRVEREKRLDVLVDALEILGGRDTQLAIAGKGSGERALRAEAGRRLPAGAVVFTGFVPDRDLPALLNCADIFVMPSEAELQSIATLEAMAAGLPVLASDAGALPELVQPGVNGFLFRSGSGRDAAQRLRELAGRRAGWPKMGAAGRAIAEGHDLSRTIRAYEDLYRRLLEKRGRVGPPR